MKYENITYLDAVYSAISEEMAIDRRVVIIGEDLAVFEKSGMFGKDTHGRVRSTPICENGFTGMAIGAAMTGLRPIVHINMANFLYLASDQIINQASKMRYMTGGQMSIPIVFRILMIHKQSSAAQHSDRPYSMFMNVPGLKIVAPSTPCDMKGLFKAAVRDNNPVLIFEDGNLHNQKGDVPTDIDHLISIGKADLKKRGKDVTIISISGCLPDSMSAAERLEKDGVSVEVVDIRTLAPIDSETIIESVLKTNRVVIVENGNKTNSAASEISAIINEHAFKHLLSPIQRVTAPDVHVPFSPSLENSLFPSEKSIVDSVRKIL